MADLWRVRAALAGTYGGGMVSTMFFDSSAGTEQGAADSVRAFWYAMRNYLANDLTVQVEPVVYTVNPTTGLATGATSTSTTPVVGASGSAQLPPATQVLVAWHTGVFIAGRELIGKTFIPGQTVDSSTDGIVASGAATVIGGAATALGSSGPPQLVIYSRKHRLYESAGLGSVDTQFAVLRSRRS